MRLYRSKLLITASLVALLAILLVSSPDKTRAASLAVTSPTNGQSFTGNDFTVTGTANAGASILLSQSGRTISQTRADGSGNWSAHLSGLPNGSNTITVRSITNSGYGYFISTGDAANTTSINQFRLSDNALNPNSPFPITQSESHLLLTPSPVNSLMYAVTKFSGPAPPSKFDASAPADPVTVTGDYPSDTTANFGSFSADGAKYYSPNINSTVVSIVDVATNAFVENVELGQSAATITRSIYNSNLMYINTTGDGSTVKILDTRTDEIVKNIDLPCAPGDFAAQTMFSRDSSYPYYFESCAGASASKVLKYKISDDTLVESFDVDYKPLLGVMGADNSKLYLGCSVGVCNGGEESQIYVMDTTSGAHIKTITLQAGALAIFNSPDFQHIYVGVPGGDFSGTGFDVIDTFTDTLSHVNTDTVVASIVAPSDAVELANVAVAVVLGAKTTSGQLAHTGVLVVLAAPLGLLLILLGGYTFYDYRRHRAPLAEAVADLDYSYFHHLKVVSIPLVKYRISFTLEKSLHHRSDKLSRF